MDSVYSVVEIYSMLKSKYKEYLKPEIVSITMIQAEDGICLETVEVVIVKAGFEKLIVRKIALDFKSDGKDQEANETGEYFFNPKDAIEVNVEKFIEEFSPFSIINTTDLFHAEACEKISRKYNTFGIDG